MLADVLQLLIIALGFGLTGIGILALKEQIKKQSGSTSVQVCLSFFDRLRDADMREISDKIRSKELLNLEEETTDWINLMRFLNHFEHISIAQDRDVIDYDSTMSFFSGYLTAMNKNKQVTTHINNQPGKGFSYLKMLLRKNIEYTN